MLYFVFLFYVDFDVELLVNFPENTLLGTLTISQCSNLQKLKATEIKTDLFTLESQKFINDD